MIAGRFISNPQNFDLKELVILKNEFNCNIAPLQNELIELQAELFSNSFDVMFWKQCKYIQLKTLATKIYSCFSSTYLRSYFFCAGNN